MSLSNTDVIFTKIASQHIILFLLHFLKVFNITQFHCSHCQVEVNSFFKCILFQNCFKIKLFFKNYGTLPPMSNDHQPRLASKNHLICLKNYETMNNNNNKAVAIAL